MSVVRGLSLAGGRRARLALVLLTAMLSAAVYASSASAAEPWWKLDVVAAPTNLPPETENEKKERKVEEAQIEVLATNIGDSYVQSGAVTVGDTLPAALKV